MKLVVDLLYGISSVREIQRDVVATTPMWPLISSIVIR
jgi:hypothetical protein